MPHPAPDRPDDLLDQMICFEVYAANLALGRLYKPLLDDIGLTYPQYLVLLALWSRDGQSVGELGARLDLDSSTLTPLIKRMEAMGHLTRTRDSADERRVIVRLTGAGEGLRQRHDGLTRCVFEATGLAPDEALTLQSLLSRMRGSLARAKG